MAAARVVAAVSAYLHAYFASPHEDTRSARQLEREKYVLWHPSTGAFSRWMVVLPAVASHATIGSMYTFSAFNKYMDSHVWGTPGSNAKAFLACVVCYGLSTSILGPWVERHGPFAAVRRTLVLAPLGWSLAALGSYVHSLPLVILGYGVCTGFATGHTYISTTSMLQKHFVDTKGFAAGLGVCGFGLGSYVFTLIAKALLDPAGAYRMQPYQVQAIFAATFFVVLACALPFMRLPPPGWTPPPPPDAAALAAAPWYRRLLARGAACCSKPGHHSIAPDRKYTFAQAAKTQEFWLLAVVIFAHSMPGIVFLSSATDMAINIFDLEPGPATIVTSFLNLTNFIGRFGYGLATDKLGRKTFFVFSCLAQAAAMALMGPFIEHKAFGAWMASFLLVGSLYGGSFGVLPAFVSELFGPKISAATHGSMISMWAISSIIGIPIFTAVTASEYVVVNGTKVPTAYAYIINSHWLAAMPVVALVAMLLLNARPRDRIARRAQAAGPLRVRVFQWVWVPPATVLDVAAQEAEWAQLVAAKAVPEPPDPLSPTPAAGSDGAAAVSPPTGDGSGGFTTVDLHTTSHRHEDGGAAGGEETRSEAHDRGLLHAHGDDGGGLANIAPLVVDGGTDDGVAPSQRAERPDQP